MIAINLLEPLSKRHLLPNAALAKEPEILTYSSYTVVSEPLSALPSSRSARFERGSLISKLKIWSFKMPNAPYSNR